MIVRAWTIVVAALALLPGRQERLEALRPSRPIDYFELAEEIADEAGSPADLDLARHLFGLAGVLDPDRLGRSACLALADLEADDIGRRRMLALASMLDPRGAALPPSPDPGDDPAAALAVAEALGHYRRGEGARAEAALRRAGAMELLESCGHVLRGGAKRFVEDCRLYRGSRRPQLGAEELATHLRLEAALLAGADRTWSGELLLSTGRPLIEVDPERIEEALGVDRSKPRYRNGLWQPG